MIDERSFNRELEELQSRGLLMLTNGRPELTEEGRRRIVVVMAGGSFDIIHPGHIETLEQARSLGDVLVVSVARDATFERNKKRKPNHVETLRRDLVASLRMVDCAVLGSESDIFETVELLKPDIIALGYDQFHDEGKIMEEAKRRGLIIKVVRLKSSNPDIKTTAIINRESGKLTSL
jgi:cytidyltransferase-like protein